MPKIEALFGNLGKQRTLISLQIYIFPYGKVPRGDAMYLALGS